MSLEHRRMPLPEGTAGKLPENHPDNMSIEDKLSPENVELSFASDEPVQVRVMGSEGMFSVIRVQPEDNEATVMQNKEDQSEMDEVSMRTVPLDKLIEWNSPQPRPPRRRFMSKPVGSAR